MRDKEIKSGTIKNLRSEMKMIINDKNKKYKRIDLYPYPNLLKIIKIIISDNSSTIGYWIEMGFLQHLAIPLKNKYEKIGILS